MAVGDELGDPDRDVDAVADPDRLTEIERLRDVDGARTRQTRAEDRRDQARRVEAMGNPAAERGLGGEMLGQMDGIAVTGELCEAHDIGCGDGLGQRGELRLAVAHRWQHRADVRIALEYKTKESRKHCTLGDAGRALHLCHQVGLENVGVTFDVGHALIAGECPAAVCALIADAGKLFYTHFNDNGTDWDWDMIPGSVHVWDLLETLYYLQRADWSGWLCYDVVTRSGDDLVGVQVATMRVMQAAEKVLAKIGAQQLAAMIERGAPHESVPALWEALL